MAPQSVPPDITAACALKGAGRAVLAGAPVLLIHE